MEGERGRGGPEPPQEPRTHRARAGACGALAGPNLGAWIPSDSIRSHPIRAAVGEPGARPERKERGLGVREGVGEGELAGPGRAGQGRAQKAREEEVPGRQTDVPKSPE